VRPYARFDKPSSSCLGSKTVQFHAQLEAAAQVSRAARPDILHKCRRAPTSTPLRRVRVPRESSD
jgi:hypothetical protein